MRKNQQIKAVIFDLDDTLIDWSGAEMSWREFNQPKFDNIYRYFVERGRDLPDSNSFGDKINYRIRYVWDEAKKTFAGASLIDAMLLAFEDCGIDRQDVDMDEVLQAYDWSPFPGVGPFPDTHQVLTELKRRGYKIGLITNAFQPMWIRDIELSAYDLLKYLDARITSGDTRFMKPHPAIYWRMLGLLNLMPEEAIYVGDRPGHDVAGAHSVGMKGVLMSPPHLNRDLEGNAPDFTVERLSELIPYLDQLG